METSAPRVNKGTLGGFVGRRVTLVGQVVEASTGGVAKLLAADGEEVRVQLQADTVLPTKYAEIVGTVNADLSITETRAVPFGESFDMASYNQLVGHIHGKFKDLFM